MKRSYRDRSPDRNRKRYSDSDHSSSSLYDSPKRSSSSDSSSQTNGAETNEAYELYKIMKQESKKAAAKKVECRLLDLEKDFPNYKRKLVVQFIPADQTEEQIMNYFYSILAQVSHETYTKNPIMSVEKERYKEIGFLTLEFRKRDDADICLDLDGTKYSSQQHTPMKIQRCKRFVIFWNDEIHRGRNPAAEALGIRAKEKNFQDFNTGGADGQNHLDDKRVFMGGIPFQMQELEVRQLCESFGKLKSFNLIKDNQANGMNKGYAFFEYQDDRAADKAIKALNQLEIKDKRLKVQRTCEGLQRNANMQLHKAVPDDKQLPIRQHCTTASRVVQFLNMISVEDLFDTQEVERVKQDVISECQSFGDIVGIEIPKPNSSKVLEVQGNILPGAVIVSYAHGKIFVKFSHIVSAKQARHALSGRVYNNRTVVVSFYPEHYFDIHEFSIV